jgi:hypothetical protein
MTIIAIILPWLSFFLRGKILTGFICLILQITLIGWLPVAIWALMSWRNEKNENLIKQMEKKIININYQSY